MPYKLYTDRNEEFSCGVNVKHASLKGAISRLIIESNDLNLVFPGKIENGKCTIPIKKLKGLLEEGDTGKIKLEIIVENTYFKPWEQDFHVEEQTAVKVRVDEQKERPKPAVSVKLLKERIDRPVQELLYICERMGISKQNLKREKDRFKFIIKEYIKHTPQYSDVSGEILKEALGRLK